ncbi:MAG TPA: RNA-binding S4 domain-containing protein [Candidatus Latescibacteria bacterium]|nr:RNA-binding S4 domain-containing protein [Candidatus Latescibacterota bacterium]
MGCRGKFKKVDGNSLDIKLRVDLFLKRCGILKRRTWAQEACERGMIFVDSRAAKPSTAVRPGQRVLLRLVDRLIEIEVLGIPPKAPSKGERREYYRVLREEGETLPI